MMVTGGMYGLIQVSRKNWKKMTEVLVSIGLKKFEGNQCLFYMRRNKHLIIILVYVDDSIMIGVRSDLDRIIAAIRKCGLTLSVEGKLNDFLGCSILRAKDANECWILQPHLIHKLKENFGEKVKDNRTYGTPGSPRKIIRKSTDKDVKLVGEKQKEYRSGVGSLLYLLKHSRPELSNPIRELSKAMHEPNTDHVKELLRVIQWVIQTPTIGLKMKPEVDKDADGNVIWKIKGMCDATWGSDPDDGRSISGYIIFLNSVPIAWKSKTQASVVLSSAEAEYVSSTEMVKEMLWIKQMLEFLELKIELPMKVYIDNISAIHMVRNNIGNSRTRHMNIKVHFVRDLHEDNIIEYIFLRSEENTTDILTKNPTRQEFERHAPKLVTEAPQVLIDENRRNKEDEIRD